MDLIAAILGIIFFVAVLLIEYRVHKLQERMGDMWACLNRCERHLAAMHQLGLNVENRETRPGG